MKTVVVIPTYNECENIVPLLRRLAEEKARVIHTVEFLVVDDNSPDGTAEAVTELAAVDSSVHLISGPKRGLGAAYVRGMEYALRELGADIVMTMDADFSHDPKDVPRLLAAMDDRTDVVIGSRYVKGGAIPQNWPFYRKLLSRFGNLGARFIVGLGSVHDCTAGFRAARASLIRRVDLSVIRVQGYGFLTSILSEYVRKGARIAEVPVIFVDRTAGESKLGFRDMLEFLLNLFWIRFGHRGTFLKFSAVGISGAVVNLGSLALMHERLGLATLVASPIAIEFSILSNFVINNTWTFAGHGPRSLGTKLLRFNMVSMASLLITYSALLLGHGVLGANYIVAQAVGIMLAMLWNYFLNSDWTWRGSGEDAGTAIIEAEPELEAKR